MLLEREKWLAAVDVKNVFSPVYHISKGQKRIRKVRMMLILFGSIDWFS
jgi:hypothetical protein